MSPARLSAEDEAWVVQRIRECVCATQEQCAEVCDARGFEHHQRAKYAQSPQSHRKINVRTTEARDCATAIRKLAEGD